VIRSVWLDGTAELGSSLAAGFLGGMHWLAALVQWLERARKSLMPRLCCVCRSIGPCRDLDMIRWAHTNIAISFDDDQFRRIYAAVFDDSTVYME
jgi:hypothetical protein